MTRQELRRLVDAHDAVWEEWWPTLVGLPRASAHRRVGGSYPNVFATTKHMVDTEVYWQNCLEACVDLDGPSGQSMARLQEIWRELRRRRAAWLKMADPRGDVEFEADGGVMATVSASECLVHMTTHAHFHRGQLVRQCRQLSVKPPSRHLIGWYIGEF